MEKPKTKNQKLTTNTFTFGFTLIEVLVVVAVLAVLLGLIASGGTAARKRAKIYEARAMIASLETALSLYHVDFGAYPAEGNQNLVNLLADAATYSSNADWEGPYISLKDDDLNGTIPNATVIDPWGRDYGYILDTVPAYKIWSLGPDGSDGTGDDIKSW